MTTKATEINIARAVIDWLTDLQWDVYQEVQIDRYGRCADIVAVQKGKVWVVECKVSFGLSVIEQADYWRYRAAHFVSIASPPSKKATHRTRALAEQFLRWRGIGFLGVRDWGSMGFNVSEGIAPKLCRNADVKPILDTLQPEHKTFAQAGASGGRRWTPFQQTCQTVAAAVKKSPGINLSELLKTTETHYGSTSTARQCIKHWAEAGKIEGVQLRRDGRRLRLYPSL